jgi:hypothetical protein
MWSDSDIFRPGEVPYKVSSTQLRFYEFFHKRWFFCFYFFGRFAVSNENNAITKDLMRLRNEVDKSEVGGWSAKNSWCWTW